MNENTHIVATPSFTHHRAAAASFPFGVAVKQRIFLRTKHGVSVGSFFRCSVLSFFVFFFVQILSRASTAFFSKSQDVACAFERGMQNESVDTRWVGSGGQRVSSKQVFFRPAWVFQELLPEHVAESGLEFSLDFSTGKNRARLPLAKYAAHVAKSTDLETVADQVIAKEVRVLPDSEGRGDSGPLTGMLVAAATWGDVNKVKTLLASCYVTNCIASKALIAAAGGGSEGTLQVVQVLLQAGASAGIANEEMDGKTALLAAAEQGNEQIMELLIANMSREEILARNGRGCTAFDVLNNMDMGAMARRLEKQIS